MDAISYLDTNLVLWLFAGMVEKISANARRRLESGTLLISPAVALELEYLYERRRIVERSTFVVSELAKQINLQICGIQFASVMDAAIQMSWTRDPFHRLITANAEANGRAALITSDRNIRRHYPNAIW
jgi:PIN domain nuclease of toxin-antitoxin system